MMLIRSDIAQRYGQTPNKLGQNRVVVSWDGSDSNDAYVDARTLYCDGNNQGVMFSISGAGSTCNVHGSTEPMPSPLSMDELTSRNWFLIGALNADTTAKVLQDFKLFSTIWLEFTAARGIVSIVR
jgi:hypothetical protein